MSKMIEKVENPKPDYYTCGVPEKIYIVREQWTSYNKYYYHEDEYCTECCNALNSFSKSDCNNKIYELLTDE